MKNIPRAFLPPRANSRFPRVHNTKYLSQTSISGLQRPRVLKNSLSTIQKFKFHRVLTFENLDRIPFRVLSLVIRFLKRSYKLIKKATFVNKPHVSQRVQQLKSFKRLFKHLFQIHTLNITSFEASSIKFCSSIRNLKLSFPEEANISARILKQFRCLNRLEKVEVCLSNNTQALKVLKEIHRRVKSRQCWLDISLLKPVWPCLDNIESISHPTFKKVASMQLNLSKLPASLPVDDKKLGLYMNPLKFLLEPVCQQRFNRRSFEHIKLPGMKLGLDLKESEEDNKTSQSYELLKQLRGLQFEHTGPFVGSFLESCLSVYASSLFYCLNKLDVKEYLPEQNLAKLCFELKSQASAWEVLDLLRDIIEFKDIKYLYLELKTKGMTQREFTAIMKEICKIERLEFLYVASGDFVLEVESPCSKSLQLQELMTNQSKHQVKVCA